LWRSVPSTGGKGGKALEKKGPGRLNPPGWGDKTEGATLGFEFRHIGEGGKDELQRVKKVENGDVERRNFLFMVLVFSLGFGLGRKGGGEKRGARGYRRRGGAWVGVAW